MRKSAFLTVVFLLIASVGFSQMTDVEETITAKEKDMYKAIKESNMDVFKENTSDDLLSIYSSGYATKDQEVESLSNLKMDSYELSDIRVIQPADGVAIIAYTLNASGKYKDQAFSGTYYSTSTWVESDGEWKAIMHTETESDEMDETVSAEDGNN